MDSSGPEEQVSVSQRGEQIDTCTTQSIQNEQSQMCQPKSDENVDMTQSKPDDEQLLVCESQSYPDENVQLSQPQPDHNVQPSQSKADEHIQSQTDDSIIDVPKSEPDYRAQLLQFRPDDDAQEDMSQPDDAHMEISHSQPDDTQVHIDMSLSQPDDAQIRLSQFQLDKHTESKVKPKKPARENKQAKRPTLEDISSDLKKLAVVVTVIAVLIVVLTVCFISIQHTTHMIGKDLSESKAATSTQLEHISLYVLALNDTKETVEGSKERFDKMTA